MAIFFSVWEAPGLHHYTSYPRCPLHLCILCPVCYFGYFCLVLNVASQLEQHHLTVVLICSVLTLDIELLPLLVVCLAKKSVSSLGRNRMSRQKSSEGRRKMPDVLPWLPHNRCIGKHLYTHVPHTRCKYLIACSNQNSRYSGRIVNFKEPVRWSSNRHADVSKFSETLLGKNMIGSTYHNAACLFKNFNDLLQFGASQLLDFISVPTYSQFCYLFVLTVLCARGSPQELGLQTRSTKPQPLSQLVSQRISRRKTV